MSVIDGEKSSIPLSFSGEQDFMAGRELEAYKRFLRLNPHLGTLAYDIWDCIAATSRDIQERQDIYYHQNLDFLQHHEPRLLNAVRDDMFLPQNLDVSMPELVRTLGLETRDYYPVQDRSDSLVNNNQLAVSYDVGHILNHGSWSAALCLDNVASELQDPDKLREQNMVLVNRYDADDESTGYTFKPIEGVKGMNDEVGLNAVVVIRTQPICDLRLLDSTYPSQPDLIQIRRRSEFVIVPQFLYRKDEDRSLRRETQRLVRIAKSFGAEKDEDGNKANGIGEEVRQAGKMVLSAAMQPNEWTPFDSNDAVYPVGTVYIATVPLPNKSKS